METKTFKVPAIHCGHCVHTIKMELGDLAGVERVEADQNSQMVTVAWSAPADWEKTVSYTHLDVYKRQVSALARSQAS